MASSRADSISQKKIKKLAWFNLKRDELQHILSNMLRYYCNGNDDISSLSSKVFDENIKDGLITLQRLLRLGPTHFTDDRYPDPVLLVDIYKVWETARSLKCIIKKPTTALPVVQENVDVVDLTMSDSDDENTKLQEECNTNKADQKEVADSCFFLDETATTMEVDSHDVTPHSSTVSTSSLPAPALALCPAVVVIETTTMVHAILVKYLCFNYTSE